MNRDLWASTPESRFIATIRQLADAAAETPTPALAVALRIAVDRLESEQADERESREPESEVMF